MGDYDLVIGRCKRLEQLLESRFGAQGRGLHEKTSSVEGKLPGQLVRKLRYIATVRNKLVHESEGNRIDDAKGYKKACDWSEAEIKRLSGGGNGMGKIIVAIIVLAVIAAVVWLVLHGR